MLVQEFHGDESDKLYEVSSFEELPYRVKSRLTKSYVFSNEIYNPGLDVIRSGCKQAYYIFSTGKSAEGSTLALADHTITYKYPTGSKIFIMSDNLREIVDFWESFTKLPIYRLCNSEDPELTGLTVRIKYPVRVVCCNSFIVYKDGKRIPSDKIILPNTALWIATRRFEIQSIYNLSLSSDYKDYGYEIIRGDSDPKAGEEVPYYYLGVTLPSADIEVVDNSYFKDFCLEDYHMREYVKGWERYSITSSRRLELEQSISIILEEYSNDELIEAYDRMFKQVNLSGHYHDYHILPGEESIVC